jgi:hypothetical protein
MCKLDLGKKLPIPIEKTNNPLAIGKNITKNEEIYFDKKIGSFGSTDNDFDNAYIASKATVGTEIIVKNKDGNYDMYSMKQDTNSTLVKADKFSIDDQKLAKKGVKEVAKVSFVDYDENFENTSSQLILKMNNSPKDAIDLANYLLKIPKNDYNMSYVKAYVAKDLKTPEATLRILSDDILTSTRDNIANNKSAPADLLEKLSNDKEESVRSYVSLNTSTSLVTLEKMISDKSESVKENLARNPNLNNDLLEKLEKSTESISTKANIAYHKNASPELLHKLADSNDTGVIYNVIQNNNTSVEDIKKIILSKKGIFTDNKIAPEKMTALAADSNPEVRLAIAKNSSTDRKLLENLAKDSDVNVRIAVYNNYNSTPEIKKLIFSTADENMKISLAKNPGSPEYLLNELAGLGQENINMIIAENKNATNTTYSQIFPKISQEKNIGIIKNTSNSGVLYYFKDSTNDDIRLEVAKNKHTDRYTLQNMAEYDGCGKVRRAAKATLKG